MEKKSKLLIAFVFAALVASAAYAYGHYVWRGDFLIDESRIEETETLPEESSLMEEVSAEDDASESPVAENE